MLLCEGKKITVNEFPEEIAGYSHNPALMQQVDLQSVEDWRGRNWNDVREEVILKAEKLYFTQLLSETRGRLKDAAKLAGITTRALYNKMQSHGLDKRNFKI
jgi:DNA-binding NtrC family response regulator